MIESAMCSEDGTACFCLGECSSVFRPWPAQYLSDTFSQMIQVSWVLNPLLLFSVEHTKNIPVEPNDLWFVPYVINCVK